MKILCSLFFLGVLTLAGLKVSLAMPVDLTLGTPGTIGFNQSFNESRGVTATPTTNLELLSMTLARFDINNSPSGTIGARVYDDVAQTLIATQDQVVSPGIDQSVTIPIEAILIAGEAYRFVFFLENANGGTADIFDPDPANSFAFSYASGGFQVTGAWSTALDAFPNTQNTSLPFVTLNVRSIPEPGSLSLLACAVLCAGALAHGTIRGRMR